MYSHQETEHIKELEAVKKALTEQIETLRTEVGNEARNALKEVLAAEIDNTNAEKELEKKLEECKKQKQLTKQLQEELASKRNNNLQALLAAQIEERSLTSSLSANNNSSPSLSTASISSNLTNTREKKPKALKPLDCTYIDTELSKDIHKIDINKLITVLNQSKQPKIGDKGRWYDRVCETIILLAILKKVGSTDFFAFCHLVFQTRNRSLLGIIDSAEISEAIMPSHINAWGMNLNKYLQAYENSSWLDWLTNVRHGITFWEFHLHSLPALASSLLDMYCNLLQEKINTHQIPIISQRSDHHSVQELCRILKNNSNPSLKYEKLRNILYIVVGLGYFHHSNNSSSTHNNANNSSSPIVTNYSLFTNTSTPNQNITQPLTTPSTPAINTYPS
jgi:hypothetical protein